MLWIEAILGENKRAVVADGEEGTAVFLGDYHPSGGLPITFPLPPFPLTSNLPPCEKARCNVVKAVSMAGRQFAKTG